MGSNGISIPHGPNNISAFGLNLSLAPATGGGCVYQGPFVNYTVNLGPVAFAPIDGDGGLDYNPRCLGRDLSLVWSNNTKPTDVVRTISSCTDLGCFDTVLEALEGIHAGGHFTIGSLNDDAYASAGDPAFWLHHSQIDRVWTIWQSLNPANRTHQVYGTSTAFNSGSRSHFPHLPKDKSVLMRPILLDPPSPNVTLDTSINFGVLAPQQPIHNLVSSIDGPFCYMYI